MPTTTATTITMPQLGESVTEGRLGNWLKQVGDRIEPYEPLVEVETDKVNSEIPSPIAGTLVEILVPSETTVPVGTGLCLIETGDGETERRREDENEGSVSDVERRPPNGDSSPSLRLSVSPSQQGIPDEMDLLRARSSPVVRRIAEEHHVDLGQIPGTGIGGRVTKHDILAYLQRTDEESRGVEESRSREVGVSRPVVSPPAPPLVPKQPTTLLDSSTPRLLDSPSSRPILAEGDEIIPLTPMRRAIAEHMVRSEQTAPHVTAVMEVDMTNVVAYRAAHREEFQRREGVDLTYLPFAMKAVTLALRDHPRLNSVWDNDRIIHRRAINLGVAVALEDGLIVPVIKNADRLSLAGLAHALAKVTTKARAGSLTPDEVNGGTFTINNPGVFGTLVSTPIIVQPQAAILSTEAIIKRPVVIDDMIAIRSMMNLSLSIDHRILDGLAAARFLQQIKHWLESVDTHLSLY